MQHGEDLALVLTLVNYAIYSYTQHQRHMGPPCIDSSIVSKDLMERIWDGVEGSCTLGRSALTRCMGIQTCRLARRGGG